MAIIEESRPTTARSVPHAMHDDLHVPRGRYYDREFFELEKQHLWPRVWQMACRLEELPDPGDFVEYEIADQSILIIRQPDHSLKAFHNACRHRATQLCKGQGRLAGGQIVCPFHGWRWNLDGTNSFVYGREGFAEECLQTEDITLKECLVDTWGGCAWINMDTNAQPLRESFAGIVDVFDAEWIESLRVWWWKEAIIEANWKMAMEAFLEGYHVMQSHPQLALGLGDAYPPGTSQYFRFPNGHGYYSAGKKRTQEGGIGRGMAADEFIARMRLLWEGQDAMVLERDLRVMEGVRRKVAPGEEFGPSAIDALYDYAEGARIPMPRRDHLFNGVMFLFPNSFVLPQFGNALTYRFRPDPENPERCRFEAWSLTTYPEGLEPQGKVRLQGRYADNDDEGWGLIPRQDMSNMQRQQRGIHSISYDEHRLATEWETLISHTHQTIDRWLGS